jgi:hypothetical protein
MFLSLEYSLMLAFWAIKHAFEADEAYEACSISEVEEWVISTY